MNEKKESTDLYTNLFIIIASTLICVAMIYGQIWLWIQADKVLPDYTCVIGFIMCASASTSASLWVLILIEVLQKKGGQ